MPWRGESPPVAAAAPSTLSAMAEPLPKQRHHGSILMAAMIGIADALGWDQSEEIPEIHAEAAGEPPTFDLTFGDLDPL